MLMFEVVVEIRRSAVLGRAAADPVRRDQRVKDFDASIVQLQLLSFLLSEY